MDLLTHPNHVRARLFEELQQRGYQPDHDRFLTGRPDRTTVGVLTPDGERAIAKYYPNGASGRTYTNLETLWQSSFGAKHQPPGLPQPLAHLEEISVIILARIEGQPLVECESPDASVHDNAIRLLAALHECNAKPEQRRDSRRIVRSARRKATRIAELAPNLGPVIWPVIEALQANRPDDTELVPSHGDFSPRNVLVGTDRVSVIDWDRFQWADPGRDLAYFGTWTWAASLRRGEQAGWSVLERAVSVYCSVRPEAEVNRQLGFHVAAGLVRISNGLVELWPDQAHWVPALAAEALRHLK